MMRSFRLWGRFWAALVLLTPVGARADEARLRCIADTNLSSYEGERDLNYGASNRIRLKGIQMMALFRFDMAPVAHWIVERATLHLRYAGNDRRLRTLGFSTVSAPWEEGSGVGEKRAGETCFSWSGLGSRSWAGPQSDFTDVSFTADGTVAAYADLSLMADGWFSVPVDPRIVQAMAAGVSYGMAVTDEKGQTAANNDVFSREQSNSQPYLVVEGHVSTEAAPTAISEAATKIDPAHADFTTGALTLQWTAPATVYAVEIKTPNIGASGAAASRNQIRLAQPGRRQSMVIAGLPPGRPLTLELTPIGVDGRRGRTISVKGMASAAVAKPSPFTRIPAPPYQPGTIGDERVRVSAYPDTEKANPISSQLLDAAGPAGYGSPGAGAGAPNAVWDGRAVRLSAARNEFVAFHLLIEAVSPPLRGVAVLPGTRFLPAASGKSALPWEVGMALYRDWYVRDRDWFPEVCVPLTGPLDIPASDNGVLGQRNQSVLVELLTPRDAVPGLYRGLVQVAVGGRKALAIPVLLEINALALPDRLGFDVSLNTYGTMGGPFGLDDRTPEYRALEREYHRMAHRHRTTLALLGYSHTGSTSTHYAPPLEAQGASLRVRDWSDFDTQFGPYLDGSAFQDMPRKGVPITHFYLPFHEAWPVDIRNHYSYQQTVTEYPALITEHAMTAPPIEQAASASLRTQFTDVTKQFADHIRSKGWSDTDFQFYQNDKYYYKDPKTGGRGTSWWLLDEPNHRDDWLALAFFARLWKIGIGSGAGARFVHREDISRPQWQRDYLDGLVDLMVVSGEIYTKQPLMRRYRERLGVRLWNYGAANAVNRPNTDMQAWAVRAWLAGADAIVPWQSVGADENYARPDETALLLPGVRFGISGPVASLRLKALRRAQQDVEYLRLLCDAKHWSRDQAAAAVAGLLKIDVSFQQETPDDAGRYRFGPIRAADFSEMRRSIAAAIGR